MSRNSMETCNEDLYLLVFRAISREKTRKGIEGGLERPRSGKGSGHSSAGWTRRNGQRGIVGKKSKKLWSRVGSFLSRRAREMAPDQKGGTRGKEGGRSGSYK